MPYLMIYKYKKNMYLAEEFVKATFLSAAVEKTISIIGAERRNRRSETSMANTLVHGKHALSTSTKAKDDQQPDA